uniref:Expressed protein n=1 Tax=Oryza sativa subsp. japonica TaxID=39947 RepID=Q10SI4_ORYSJ|nr:expressed protein [Oryza sativa Japonica Group]
MAEYPPVVRSIYRAYKDRIACREHLVASLMQCKQAQGEKGANEQQLHTTLHFYTLPLATVEVFLEQ